MAQPLARPRKTIEDYLALPDDVRAELIGGELYVTPSPRPEHQTVAMNLSERLAPLVRRFGLGRIWAGPLDVHLPTGDIVQPDLLLVGTDQMDIVREDAVRGAPILVVEILSPSSPERDLFVKRELYARNGVREYWIVDPSERAVQVLVLASAGYAPAGWFVEGTTLASPTLPDIVLDVKQVFA